MNLKVHFLFLTLIYFTFSCEKPGECPSPLGTATLQSPTEDATIVTISPGTNYGGDSKIFASAWTYSGNPTFMSFLLKFDYSSLPSHLEISSATLSLYADTSNIFTGTPYPMSGHYGGGTDSSYVKRVTSRWDENSVSWNSKPSSTTINKIKFPPTTDSAQAFNLDVTKIVEDQIQKGNFGFEFGLLQYLPYQRIVFYSSESPFSNLRPKLVINYKKLN